MSAAKRHQHLRRRIRLVDVEPGEVSIEFPVGRADLEMTLLSLSLLSHGLVERVVFTSDERTLALRRGHVTKLVDAASVRSEIEFAERELRLIEVFLLTYYRDGAADVDHIDIDLGAKGGGSSALFVHVDEVKTPLPGSLARKHLLDE